MIQRRTTFIIVLDGTVGQNAISQVKAFQTVADVSGLIVTKLDGSAKGGIVIALAGGIWYPCPRRWRW